MVLHSPLKVLELCTLCTVHLPHYPTKLSGCANAKWGDDDERDGRVATFKHDTDAMEASG